MKVLTFDLETENHKLNKRLASPFDKRNYIVEAGWSWNGGEAKSVRRESCHRDDIMSSQWDQLNHGDIINGFNIKFDLLWVWDSPSFQAALKRGATIYCGQYAEYLLGGQTTDVQMCAMNDIATKYGGGCKIDAVKEMWENGYLTSQIPPDLLHDYLVGNGEIVGDVMNTWLIFQGQVERMKKEHPKEFLTMFKFRLDGLLATCEMEYNGVYCDKDVGLGLRKDLVEKLEKATVELDAFVPELPAELVFNWASSLLKSCLIFGGVAKYPKWVQHTDENGTPLYSKKTVKYPLFSKVPVPPEECKLAGDLYVIEVPEDQQEFAFKGKFYRVQDSVKSGLNTGAGKFRNVEVQDLDKPKGALTPHYFKFEGYTKPQPSWKTESTDAYGEPLYSTGAPIINKLALRGLPFTDALSKRTSIDKDLGTYYWKEDKKGRRKGMLTLVDDDGLIHHKLNHTSTVTSRLSSSDPNLQTLPRGSTSEVKKMFMSRFIKKYESAKVGEVDYSQLEVVIQGVLTGDEQLCKDLNAKVDFHCKRLAYKVGKTYEEVVDLCKVQELPEWVDQRTKAKAFSFKRAYGAGVAAIVEADGIPKDDVEALIAAEEAMYPGIMAFDKYLEAKINSSRIATKNNLFLDGVAFKQGEARWDSPTGTRYKWREDITPTFLHKHGKYTGFSPTERKNYPVQGFGGEVVQTMLGLVFRYMLKNDRFNGEVLLVNTVHDCVWLDGYGPKFEGVVREVQEILEDVPNTFNNAYKNLEVNVPFPCESEVGKDMFTMTKLH